MSFRQDSNSNPASPPLAASAATAQSSAAGGKPVTWRRRLLRALLLYVVVPYVVILVVMVAGQRWFIFRPTRTARLQAAKVVGPGIRAEDIALHAANGLTLNGWRFHADPDAKAEPPFLAIYFPGNAGCRADRIADCRDLAQLGCDVILFDYRGYGDNKGSPSEVLLAADARRAWLFALSELNVPPERIVLFGESLGGAVATRLAAEFCQAGTPPAALILNSTFASLGETVAWHYPAFPFQYLLVDRFGSVDRIGHVTCPILQFHGTDDAIVAFSQGQRLFDAAPARSASGIEKRFVTIPGGQHNMISVGDLKTEVKSLLTEITERSVTQTLEGRWAGSWGHGQHDGAIFQPVLANLVIQGTTIRMSGFRNAAILAGTFRIDAASRKIVVTPTASNGNSAPPLEFSFVLLGESLRLIDSDMMETYLSKEKPPTKLVTDENGVALP